jgi:hypothetical protein
MNDMMPLDSEPEIAVTREMIDAGSTMLSEYDQAYDRLDETVLKILEAIFGERLSLQPSNPAPRACACRACGERGRNRQPSRKASNKSHAKTWGQLGAGELALGFVGLARGPLFTRLRTTTDCRGISVVPIRGIPTWVRGRDASTSRPRTLRFVRRLHNRHVAAHHARELAGNCKPQPGAAETLRGRRLGLGELLEQLSLSLRCTRLPARSGTGWASARCATCVPNARPRMHGPRR